MVKDLQKVRRLEEKQPVTRDVTDEVFATPAEEKDVEIELEAPPPKATKKKEFKRKRMQRLKMR